MCCLCCRECVCSSFQGLGSLSSLCFTLLETYVLWAGQCQQQYPAITDRYWLWYFCILWLLFVYIFTYDHVQQLYLSDGATEAAQKDVWQNKSTGHHYYDSKCTVTDFYFYFVTISPYTSSTSVSLSSLDKGLVATVNRFCFVVNSMCPIHRFRLALFWLSAPPSG